MGKTERMVNTKAKIIDHPEKKAGLARMKRIEKIVDIFSEATCNKTGKEIGTEKAREVVEELLSRDSLLKIRRKVEIEKKRNQEFFELIGVCPEHIPFGWGCFGSLVCAFGSIDKIGPDFVKRALTDERCLERIKKYIKEKAEVVGYSYKSDRLTFEAQRFAWEAQFL